jgi:hypothetical protein
MYTRLCSGCGVERTYSDKNKYERAEAAKSMCRKCANTKTNKTISRKGSENAAWTGYKDVPGKIFSRLRNGAKKRNIEVTITIEDIHTQYIKQHKQCAFTGVLLEFGLDASVDRINSQEGYHVWNIQIVHKTMNMMKKDMPNDLFISWCRMVK